MKKYLFVIVFIILFATIRDLHFADHLNFSTEQAEFSLKALDLWESKNIELIGPPISFRLDGRYVFQGSITYYAMIPFLLAGGKDPVTSSYLLMLFAAVGIVPLFLGTKKLIDQNAAIIMSALYALAPMYIDYTRFFWNPNFQLILTPWLIFALSLFVGAKKHRALLSGLCGVLSGVFLLFHYQYVLVIIGLLTFIAFVSKKQKGVLVSAYLAGTVIGFSPMLIFEIRNEFYNFQTILLFLQHLGSVLPKNSSTLTAHYFLAPSLFLVILALYFSKDRLDTRIMTIGIVTLALFSFWTYGQKPAQGFGMAENWNITDEEVAFEIIANERVTSDIENYNVANLIYNTTSQVQRYFHRINNLSLDTDYYKNEYLYVLTQKDRTDYLEDAAYEVNTFQPSTLIDTWEINETYAMHLLQRQNTTQQ